MSREEQKKKLSALLGKRITKIAIRDNCIEITLEGVIVMTFSYDGGYCPDMMIDGDGVV